MDIKIDMVRFLKYDWVYLSTIQLDGCEIDDAGWYLFVAGANFYFPNLKDIFIGNYFLRGIADNNITNIMEGDLDQFPSLKMI